MSSVYPLYRLSGDQHLLPLFSSFVYPRVRAFHSYTCQQELLRMTTAYIITVPLLNLTKFTMMTQYDIILMTF